MTAPVPPEPEDEPNRGAGNLLGLAVAILLIAGGAYLAIELIDSVAYQKCAAAGRRNCDKIDIAR